MMSAIALTGAVSFSACSSSDEIVDNPDYNPETNSVKTTITLSINPNNGTTTRQSSGTVQTSGFRGISDILSIPNTGDIATSTSTSGKLEWESISGFDGSSANYKLYNNQDIAVGVDYFLFIGKAPATTVTTPDDKLTNGYTTNNLSTAATVGAIQIVPDSIVLSSDITTSNSTTKNWKYQSDALVSYLNSIANASGWSATTNASLKGMYQQFTRTTISAGSAESVRLLLKDLLDKTAGMTDAIVTDETNGIRAKIAAKATISGNGPYTVTWKDDCEFKNFPTCFGLPEGSAVYVWDATTDAQNPTFKYITTGTTSAVSTPVSKIVYPNELYYLTKTPLRATSSGTVNWPANATLWASETWSTPSSWSSSVEPTSKNIALKYNINYGSALLATQVKAASTLYDNARQLDPAKVGVTNATNNSFAITGNEFELTGILVGSQPSAVAWNFLPVSGATFDKAVYDGKMNGTINVGTEYNETPNYTLVFDDYKATAADVNVCLEFKNNMSTSFYGQDGVILPGQTFYIVGKLKVTEINEASAANPFYQLDTDDNLDAYIPSRVLRVFIQDHTTTAKFVISAGTETGDGDGSLAHAVTTVPDLRQSSQTVGLSVDLVWKSGITFTDVNLGGN